MKTGIKIKRIIEIIFCVIVICEVVLIVIGNIVI